jgi:phosphate uptake regulator
MQFRKIQQMGGASFLVTLPKEWARTAMLKKGSLVSIDTTADGGVLIYPIKEPSKNQLDNEIEIVYPSRFGNSEIPKEITAAYLLGYNVIRLKGRRRVASEDRERIVLSLKKLIGLEIVEEDNQSITAQFLVDDTAVEPNKIFKRISMLVKSMISDTIKQFASGEQVQFESIAQRDDEVDRLHFLLVRLLRAAVRQPKTANRFALTTIDCLDYRVAANSLETAGDCAVELSAALSGLNHVDESAKENFSRIEEELDSIQIGAAKSFIDRDFSRAQSVLERCQTVELMLSSFRENILKTEAGFLRASDIMERILRCQRDIVDLVTPLSPIRRY